MVKWSSVIRRASVTLATVVPLLATAFGQQPQYPAADLTVTVTAKDGANIADAIETLSKSSDPLVAGLAGKMLMLAQALTQQPKGRPAYTVGPLASEEESAVKLRGYLEKFEDDDGPIRLELLKSWTDTDPRLFRLSVPRFLEMLAAIAKGPFAQVPVMQRQQLIFLGRMVMDLNQQAGGVIKDRDIFAALAGGFDDTSVSGRLGRVVQAMAVNGGTYDLIPEHCIEDVAKVTSAGFIVPAKPSDARRINVTFNKTRYTTTADDLLWSLMRFFAGDKSPDWAELAKANTRIRHGREILEYLEAQIGESALGRPPSAPVLKP